MPEIQSQIPSAQQQTSQRVAIGSAIACGCCASTASDGAHDDEKRATTFSQRMQQWSAVACAVLTLTGFSVANWEIVARFLVLIGVSGLAVADRQVPAQTPSVFYGLGVVAGGWPVLRGAFASLAARSLDMNVLMSIAITGACVLGDWGEAAALVFLYAVSERIELASVRRSQSAISRLMKLAPQRVLVRRNPPLSSTQYSAASANLVEVEASQVSVGEVFVVRSGERVALDGIVVVGDSEIDQAPVTGESLPVAKTIGDEIFAGTLNGSGVLDVRATRHAHEGTTARIARLVLEAQTQKSPRQQTVETFARYYTPLVLGLALLAAVVPPLIFATSWNESVLRALALLVAACPCALVLSGPVAVICALSFAARQGILVRGGAALESLAQVRAIAFDKTGTLTQGTPTVREFLPLNGLATTDSLGIAAALEAHSKHPLARAVVEFAKTQNAAQVDVSSVQEMGGRGVSGDFKGRSFRIGRAELFSDSSSSSDRESIAALQARGRSVAVLGNENGLVAAFAFADTLRPEAKGVLANLQGQGMASCTILSGDNESAVRELANEVGLGEWQANLLPQDKLDAVRRLSQKYGRVAMVGDGINDAPALALADIGVAMGAAGSDAAIEAADVALMSDDLQKLPQAISIARRASAVIMQNIVVALVMKAIFIGGLFFNVWGDYQLIGGVIADTGATLLVTTNALRLLYQTRL